MQSGASRLLRGILAGQYPSGTVLSELGVAREFEVSRTPVHDALRQLAKDGLVKRDRHCRARVASITSDDVFEIFEMRKLLEGPAAEYAATRMDVRQLSPLKVAAAALQKATRAKEWAAQWAEFDDLFFIPPSPMPAAFSDSRKTLAAVGCCTKASTAPRRSPRGCSRRSRSILKSWLRWMPKTDHARAA